MTDEEIWKVRYYMAEARAASSSRSAKFSSEYADLMVEISECWQSQAKDGASLTPEIISKVDEFRRKHMS